MAIVKVSPRGLRHIYLKNETEKATTSTARSRISSKLIFAGCVCDHPILRTKSSIVFAGNDTPAQSQHYPRKHYTPQTDYRFPIVVAIYSSRYLKTDVSISDLEFSSRC